ncbi:hypothetical protein [Thermus oshimai]
MRLLRMAKDLEKLAKDRSPGKVVIWVVPDDEPLPDPATRRRLVEEARAKNPGARYLVIHWPTEEP